MMTSLDSPKSPPVTSSVTVGGTTKSSGAEYGSQRKGGRLKHNVDEERSRVCVSSTRDICKVKTNDSTNPEQPFFQSMHH